MQPDFTHTVLYAFALQSSSFSSRQRTVIVWQKSQHTHSLLIKCRSFELQSCEQLGAQNGCKAFAKLSFRIAKCTKVIHTWQCMRKTVCSETCWELMVEKQKIYYIMHWSCPIYWNTFEMFCQISLQVQLTSHNNNTTSHIPRPTHMHTHTHTLDLETESLHSETSRKGNKTGWICNEGLQ